MDRRFIEKIRMTKITIILKKAPILLRLTTLKHKKRALFVTRLFIDYSIFSFS